MASKRFLVALLACGLAASACEDSTEVDPGQGATVPFEDMPEKVAEALCAAYQECLGDYASFSLGGEDCEELFEKAFASDGYEQMKAAQDAGTATYHGDKAQACLDALAALGCDALIANSVPECDEAFAGTVDAGGDCTYDVECVGDLYCLIDGSCPGTCTAPGGTGADCDGDDQCEAGLYCEGDTSSCQTPAGAGDDCGEAAEAECAPGLLCIGEDEDQGTPGSCMSTSQVLVGQVGDGCDLFAGPWCEMGAHCAVIDFTGPGQLTMECVATADSGGDCHPAGPDMCPTGEFCEVPMQSIDGTCMALPGDGEPCADSWTKGCEAYHRCVDDVCEALQDNGGSCTDDDVCHSGHCNGGTCGPYDPC